MIVKKYTSTACLRVHFASPFDSVEGAAAFNQESQMSGLSGMEFIRSLPTNQIVIFTTAFEQYALEGIKVDALDYLLKPICYPEYLNAAN